MSVRLDGLIVQAHIGFTGKVFLFQVRDRKGFHKFEPRFPFQHTVSAVKDFYFIGIGWFRRQRILAGRSIILKGVTIKINLICGDNIAPHNIGKLLLHTVGFYLILCKGKRIGIDFLNLNGKRRSLDHIELPFALNPAKAGTLSDVAFMSLAPHCGHDRHSGANTGIIAAIITDLHIAVLNGSLGIVYVAAHIHQNGA